MKKRDLFVLRTSVTVSVTIAIISGIFLFIAIAPMEAGLANRSTSGINTVLAIIYYLSAGASILFAGILTIKNEQNSRRSK